MTVISSRATDGGRPGQPITCPLRRTHEQASRRPGPRGRRVHIQAHFAPRPGGPPFGLLSDHEFLIHTYYAPRAVGGHAAGPDGLTYEDLGPGEGVPEGQKALDRVRQLLAHAGLALKGADGPPVDLREGGVAKQPSWRRHFVHV